MKRRWILWVLIFLWLLFIWGQSLLDSALSHAESGRFLALLVRYFPWLTEHLVRKIAHFVEYAVLGMLFRAGIQESRTRIIALVPFFGVLAALLDETIQLYSAGRSGQISDVWLDLAGFLTGYLLILLLFRKKTRTD